jgi:hypothetical protein
MADRLFVLAEVDTDIHLVFLIVSSIVSLCNPGDRSSRVLRSEQRVITSVVIFMVLDKHKDQSTMLHGALSRLLSTNYFPQLDLSPPLCLRRLRKLLLDILVSISERESLCLGGCKPVPMWAECRRAMEE